jgi:spingomyelin synthetase, putative
MSKPVANSTAALGPTRVKDQVKIEIPNSFPRRHYSHSQEDEDILTRSVFRNEKCGCCRTTIAFLFMFTGMVSNLIILSIVHERVPMDITHPLPDLGFDIFPEVDWVLDIAEYIIIIFSALVLLLLAIHRHRYLFNVLLNTDMTFVLIILYT